MANYILDEFLNTQKAQQGLEQQRVETAGQKTLNTLNDLRAKEMQQKLAPDSPENLLRQLQGMQTQSDISNFATTEQAGKFKSQSDLVAAADDYAQKRLDIGVPGQQVADELVQQNMLPAGTQAKKIYDSDLGESIWNFRAPGGEWTPFNKDVIKTRRELGAKKSLETWTNDAAANAKLTSTGYRWTKDKNLEVIPGGPADITGTNWSSMQGAPSLMKLQVYRQNLIDTGAPQKLVDEVDRAINKPETLAAILAPLYKKSLRGEPFTDEEINTIELAKTVGNPFAQMMINGMEEAGMGLTTRLRSGTSGGRIPTAPSDPTEYNKFYEDLPAGAVFYDPEGKKRTKPK